LDVGQVHTRGFIGFVIVVPRINFRREVAEVIFSIVVLILIFARDGLFKGI
jgi:hypothetical protein